MPTNFRIWIVEDDRATQRLIAKDLHERGFDSQVFGNGEEALAALSSHPLPALIIVDMLLPGMSGVDLIRLLKQNEEWEKLPVVVVTVLTKDESLATPEDEKNCPYWINKPLDTTYLMDTIEGILAAPR